MVCSKSTEKRKLLAVSELGFRRSSRGPSGLSDLSLFKTQENSVCSVPSVVKKSRSINHEGHEGRFCLGLNPEKLIPVESQTPKKPHRTVPSRPAPSSLFLKTGRGTGMGLFWPI